ncbi:FUSC family protein [Gordonia jacobaea]|uniref:FUSC family protein n=1 Tax=Gordonia jacobaea TaxID=122202 RepID=UPI0022DEA95B|nr:FUSC family protein [Gordonia jacobaea]
MSTFLHRLPQPVQIWSPRHLLRLADAADPGRQRLHDATLVTSAVALSTGATWVLVATGHADQSMLVVPIITALVCTNSTKDATPQARLVTAGLQLILALLFATLAALLEPYRLAAVAVFVAVAGLSVWVRRFGPRGGALGFAAFFPYFLTLLLRLDHTQLPVLWLVIAFTLGAGVLLRAALLRERPQRQITLLLREFRIAADTALLAAQRATSLSGRPHIERDLARLVGMSLAIDDWQSRFDTHRYLHCEPQTLADLVVDAQISVEQVCSQLVADRFGDTSQTDDGALPRNTLLVNAITDLHTVLAKDVDVEASRAAARRAKRTESLVDLSEEGGLATLEISRCVRTWHALNELTASVRDSGAMPPADSADGYREHHRPRLGPATLGISAPPWKLQHWRNWEPTSRLAVQVMFATALASVVGEAISASRWYWAVLTAFIVFIKASTRAAVLTRAMDRIVGTLLGVVIGALVVVVANHHVIPELILGVLCVFLASYFGPIQYTYLVAFITVMIAALFDLLGVFDVRLLVVRVEETVAGSLIGVVCAYLILSTNSRPMLIDSIAKYFDALDDALACVATGLTTAGERHQITEAARRLEQAKVDVESACSSTRAVALLEPRSSTAAVRQPIVAIHHCAHSLLIAAIVVSGSEPPQVFTGTDATDIREALDRIRERAKITQAALSGEAESAVDPARIPVISLLAKLNVEPDTPRGEAIVAASRLNQVLEELDPTATKVPDAAEQQ